jgi:hypothetical protein
VRANLNDTELLKKIQSAKSPTPLTVEEVANLVGSMRHKVVPLLRGLAASGHIEIINPEDGSSARFVLKQKPAGSAEQFTDNVVNHPAQLKRRDDKAPAQAKAKAKVEAQPAKPKVKKTASTLTPASIEPKAAAATSAPSPAPVKSTAPATAPAASVSVSADLPDRDKILLILKQAPMKREDILRKFGAMGDVLQGMIQAGEVQSDYIINDHVFELTDKGYEAVEAITAKAAVVAEEQVVVAPAVEAPAAPAPVVAAPVAPAPEPVVAAPEPVVAAPAPVAVVSAPAPAPAAKKAEEEPQAPAQPAPSEGLDNPIMQQVAKLVEQLVSERLTELTEQLTARAQDHQKLVAAAAGIQKATAHLQLGIDALNEVARTIAE